MYGMVRGPAKAGSLETTKRRRDLDWPKRSPLRGVIAPLGSMVGWGIFAVPAFGRATGPFPCIVTITASLRPYPYAGLGWRRFSVVAYLAYVAVALASRKASNP